MYLSACNPVGSLFYPAPQASPAGPTTARLGWVPEPRGRVISWWELRGWRRGGAMSWCCLPVTLHLELMLQQAVGWPGCSARGLDNPPTPGLGLRAPRAVGSAAGKGMHWLCQDFAAQSGSQPDSPSSWEKGPAHFPRPRTPDLLTPTRRKGHGRILCHI